jgi:hypothetical protein
MIASHRQDEVGGSHQRECRRHRTAVCVLGLTCPRAQDAGPHAMFADEMRLCLAPDVFYSEPSNPPPIRLEGVPLRRLFANDSRFYRGAQAEVDLVLAYQRRDVVLLVRFAEGCAASLPRTIDAEAWEVLSGIIWRSLGAPPPAWLG